MNLSRLIEINIVASTQKQFSQLSVFLNSKLKGLYWSSNDFSGLGVIMWTSLSAITGYKNIKTSTICLK